MRCLIMRCLDDAPFEPEHHRQLDGWIVREIGISRE